MIEWNDIVIATSLLLLCFLLWKEVMRVNKLRLILRIIASILAVVSLACIALPVTINFPKTVTVSKEAVLLTEGFDKDSVQKFMNSASGHLPVYTTEPGVIKSAKSFETKLISYPEIYNLSSKKISTLHVFGYGLRHDELEQLHGIPIVFHPAKVPAGITSVFWKQKLNAGEKLRLQGHYNNSSSETIKMLVRGLNTTLDSITIGRNSVKSFELSTIPKHIDKAVFSLLVMNGKDTIAAEDIPVEVIAPKTLRVLMLASSPDFENKFLKNRLSQNGYSVVYRSRMSKDKFQKEYLNTSAVPLNPITSSVLEKFDVLIADADELASISKSELAIIQSQVQNKGLGLIVKADSSISSAPFYTKNFSFTRGKENYGQVVSLFLKSTNDNAVKLFIEHPVYLRSHPGTQSLVFDNTSSAFVNITIYGIGKIIITTLENTYTLLLSGNHKNYDALWSLLLDKAAKKIPSKETVFVSPALPKLNEPFYLIIQNTDNTWATGQVGGVKVYLQQDKLLPFIQNGIYWPGQTGWIPEVSMEGKINWLYVYKKNDWSVITASNKLRATAKYASKNIRVADKNNKVKKNFPFSVPKVYFFFIFIISSGFLWFEKKLL